MAFLFNPATRWLAGLLFTALVVAGAYWKGYSAADQKAKVAELQSALIAARQDLDAQRAAAERSRRAAAQNELLANESQRRLDDYEKNLKSRGAKGACVISDDDIRWLRQYGHGSDETATRR